MYGAELLTDETEEEEKDVPPGGDRADREQQAENDEIEFIKEQRFSSKCNLHKSSVQAQSLPGQTAVTATVSLTSSASKPTWPEQIADHSQTAEGSEESCQKYSNIQFSAFSMLFHTSGDCEKRNEELLREVKE